MRALFLAIAVVAGAALAGRLAGPVAAVPIAFFGLWGALVLWTLGRVPSDVPSEASDVPSAAPPGGPAGDPAPTRERESGIEVPI